MKRLPILLTIILILTSCLDESIFGTKTSKYEIHYTTSDGQPVYIHYKLMSGFGHVVVSNTYENGLGIIKFKEGVESISDNAFANSNLVSISIPECITSIGDQTFMGVASL